MRIDKKSYELGREDGGGGGGTTNYNNLSNKPKINNVELQGNLTSEDLGIELHNDYLSCRRLGAYLYELTFDSIPDYVPSDNFAFGGCSTFIRDGKMHRSFDLTYDEVASFWVKTKTFEGIARIQGVEDGDLNLDLIGQAPYCLADGVNNNGVMVSEHVLYNDFGFAGTGDKSNDMTVLPTTILANLTTVADITTDTTISDFLANMNVPTVLAEKGYVLQFVVSDGSTTYCITPKTNGSAYEIVDISALPKLTNFKWLNKATLERNDADLQTHPTGVERWNEIDADTTLADLRFTKCYEAPTRLSEFIGENDTTKDSTDAELTALYELAQAEYHARTRNGATWQSVHSVIYGNSAINSLCVQENYDKDYIVQIPPQAPTAWGDIEGTLANQTDLQDALDDKINIADIVDNLTSTDTDKPLSAKQGKTLNELLYKTPRGDSFPSIYENGKFFVLQKDYTVGSFTYTKGLYVHESLAGKEFVLNNSLIGETDYSWDVNFIAPDYNPTITFSKLLWEKASMGMPMCLKYRITATGETVTCYNANSGWLNTMCKKVQFVDGADIENSDLMNFMRDNCDGFPSKEHQAHPWILVADISDVDLSDYYTKEETDDLLAEKQDKLVSGDNIKTINGNNVLGSGDLLTGIVGYYSAENDKFYKNVSLEIGEWDTKTWSGGNPIASYIWQKDGVYYYSNGSTQKYLDEDGAWKSKSWSGLTNFNGSYIWEHNGTTYYSSGSTQYYLDDNEWKVKEWVKPSTTSLFGSYIWKKDDVVHYDYMGSHWYLDDDGNFQTYTWDTTFNVEGNRIWSHNGKYYFSNGSGSGKQRKLVGNEWVTITDWSFMSVLGQSVWNLGNHTYYSNSSEQYEFTGDDWVEKTWAGSYGSFLGSDVWTKDDIAYRSPFSGSNYQCPIEKIYYDEIEKQVGYVYVDIKDIKSPIEYICYTKSDNTLGYKLVQEAMEEQFIVIDIGELTEGTPKELTAEEFATITSNFDKTRLKASILGGNFNLTLNAGTLVGGNYKYFLDIRESSDIISIFVEIYEDSGKYYAELYLKYPESAENKITEWSSTPSDTKYPSEKLVKNAFESKHTIIDVGSTSSGTLTTEQLAVLNDEPSKIIFKKSSHVYEVISYSSTSVIYGNLDFNAFGKISVSKSTGSWSKYADENLEIVSNKKTSWSSTPSNTNYPSEKLVKNSLDNKADDIDNGSTNVDRETIIKLVRTGHMTTIKAYLTQPESPTGSAGAFHFIGYRFTDAAGWLIATRYTTDMWISRYSGGTFTDWKPLNIEDSTNVRYFDTGSTATTRATIMNKLTKDYSMMNANVYFNAAESPNGSAGYWLCEIYRYNEQIGFIKATNFGKDVYICNKLSGTFNAWSLLSKKEVSLTTSNYKTELSTANTKVGDEVCYNYVNGTSINSASGHFVRIRSSASQWTGCARIYINSKYYLAFSMSVLSAGNIQFSYIDESQALQTVDYAPSSAGEWLLIKH